MVRGDAVSVGLGDELEHELVLDLAGHPLHVGDVARHDDDLADEILPASELHDQGVVHLGGEVPVEIFGVVDHDLRRAGAEYAVRVGLEPAPEAREGERRGRVLDALLGCHGQPW